MQYFKPDTILVGYGLLPEVKHLSPVHGLPPRATYMNYP